MKELVLYAERSVALLHSTLNEFASAVILSTQCEISRLSSRQCVFGNETVFWFYVDGVLALPPQPTEFHRKHGIPENASILDWVVISGFEDSAFRVSVQHRNSTPELREFFDRVDEMQSK